MSFELSASPTRSLAPLSPNAAPMALTPRSKVKAMLATFDDDDEDLDDNGTDKENNLPFAISDHADTKKSTPPQPVSTSNHQDSRVATAASPLYSPQSNDNLVSESDEDDDDVVIPRPRKGTLAARMQTHTSRALSDEESLEDGEAAYERVKRKIFASKAQSQDSPGTTPKEQRQEDRERGLSDAEDELGSADELSRNEEGQRHVRPASGTPPQSPSSRTSPGLFISPERPSAGIENLASGTTLDSDGATQAPRKVGNRLQALLERKRLEIKEREEKNGRGAAPESEDDSDESVSAPQPPKKTRTEVLRAESEDDDDREVGRKLTQQARPTRKASKKALEEMNRETQRLSRNMQLTHEARTKKKFPVADFLAKFSHKQPTNADQPEPAPSSSSAPGSPDAESAPSPDTAPSSPPSLGRTPEKATNVANGVAAAKASEALLEQEEAEKNEEVPDINSLLTQAANGSTHGNTAHQSNENIKDKTAEPTSKRYSAKRFAKSAKPVRAAADSDDDLEIVMTVQPSRLPVFDNLPKAKARESGSMHALRALAQLHDTEKPQNRGKKSMSRAELDALNRRRAREQAKIERDEKIQRLREKGVLVQSAEEKEQEQMQLENMLERARKEAEEIAKREKEAAKKEGKADDDDFLDSEDEDEDYQASDEEEEEEVRLSGSEDEAEGDDADEEDDVERSDQEEAEEADAPNSLLDNEAADGSDEDETAEAQAEEEMEDGVDLASEEDMTQEQARVEFSRQKARRKRVVVSDDEDEEEVGVTTQSGSPLPQATTPNQPSSNAFGFTSAKPVGLGLSQFFAGTMAESQTQAEDDAEIDSQQDSLAFLRGIPPPDLPDFTTPQTVESPNVRVRDSQVEETPTHRQSQLSGPVYFETQPQSAFFETLISEMPDPSQDVGFQVGNSQAPMMNPTFSTVDTQPLVGSIDEEPQKRRGRLVQKTGAHEDLDNGSDIEETSNAKVIVSSNIFDVMRDAAKRPVTVDEFDKKKSEAKGMVEEQAEESEDEYAGLGGASDDESTGDVDEETKRMIDDDDNAATNERDIAAYYAEKERLEDEKGIEKLYKDVINGGLRRKRGAQDDLWESDDEDEIVARRRLAKQREFAKMRKALLADEKLGKIAANPKQQAFLQTVEDRDDNDDFDFLDQPQDDVSQVTDSQSDTLQRQRPLSSVSANAQKRKYSDFEDVGGSQVENRPPPNIRRTTKATRPTSLADIRNTLSEIIGEPEAILESQGLFFESPAHSADEFENDSDGDDEAEASDDEDLYRRPSETEMLPPPVPASQLVSKASPRNRRRTAPSVAKSTVIDRMALKRSASSSTTASTSSSDRLAFHAPAKAAYAGFRVPSLLRRATTNSSTLSTSSTSTSASDASGGLGGKESVKMGGTKKSSVNYYVREKERRAKVEQVERERQEGRERVGKMRRSVVAGGIGALTGGNFE